MKQPQAGPRTSRAFAPAVAGGGMRALLLSPQGGPRVLWLGHLFSPQRAAAHRPERSELGEKRLSGLEGKGRTMRPHVDLKLEPRPQTAPSGHAQSCEGGAEGTVPGAEAERGAGPVPEGPSIPGALVPGGQPTPLTQALRAKKRHLLPG